MLVNVDCFSLVDLIGGENVILELLQDDANAENIAGELHRLINDDERRQQIFAGYERVRKKLGESGASGRAAQLALHVMERA